MQHREQTIISCDGLLDGTGSPAIEDAAIRLQGERIAAVGPAAGLRPQPGERIIDPDFRGLWISPGFRRAYPSQPGGRWTLLCG